MSKGKKAAQRFAGKIHRNGTTDASYSVLRARDAHTHTHLLLWYANPMENTEREREMQKRQHKCIPRVDPVILPKHKHTHKIKQ